MKDEVLNFRKKTQYKTKDESIIWWEYFYQIDNEVITKMKPLPKKKKRRNIFLRWVEGRTWLNICMEWTSSSAVLIFIFVLSSFEFSTSGVSSSFAINNFCFYFLHCSFFLSRNCVRLDQQSAHKFMNINNEMKNVGT